MGRSPCCDKTHTNKGAWTKEEDERLINYIHAHGQGCWRSLPKAAGLLRCGKSCRLRWINYLRPDLKRGNFTQEEDEIIIKLHSLFGNKWSLIAGRLPGRTDNEIKNYWNTHIKRKLINRGFEHQTHSPPTTAAATTTTTDANNSSLELKNASPPLILSIIDTKLPAKLVKENRCNSGTTNDLQLQKNQDQQNHHTLDLKLSIGVIPFQSETQSSSANSSTESKTTEETWT